MKCQKKKKIKIRDDLYTLICNSENLNQSKNDKIEQYIYASRRYRRKKQPPTEKLQVDQILEEKKMVIEK